MTAREFNESYLPLSDALYRVAYYLLESEDDARDAVQDLYARLWSSLDGLDSVHNPKAYCITMIRNICLDRIRKAGRMSRSELPDNIPEQRTVDRDLEQKERLRRVMEAMDRLSESQRTVLRMKVLEELSYEEIEQKTGMNNLTLRVLLSQARNRLKKVL